jgi:transposase InsO family protein
MSAKRTYFGFSTPPQRKLLFETWEATGSITQACQKARLSRRSLYYWKPRFDEFGYPGLEEFASRVAHKLNYKSAEIAQRVTDIRRENPDWGKTRIAQEMAKANNWVPLVSPNTVKRILRDAELWPERGVGGKRNREVVARTSAQPGQAINVDLCFVPEEHVAQEKLPAVSGSSGHLVIERLDPPGEEAHWPGQIFAETDLDYVEAMCQYAQATRERLVRRPSEHIPALEEATRWRKEWEGRAERYHVREQRKREDIAWKVAKSAWRQTRQAYQAMPRAERKERRAAYQLACQAWEIIRRARQTTLQQRQPENQAWHQSQREIQAGSAEQIQARSWIAILVVTDNCTRQCLGLPIFRTGSKVTSDEVVMALCAILPKGLAFLISDQGTHFRSKALADLALEAGFIHIPVYRHRPESNGIAERFVLTLKDWLGSKSWNGAEALRLLLLKFQPEYNDRPHQGLTIPGLSPNEFAKRIWLM